MKIITLAFHADDEDLANSIQTKLRENDPIWAFNFKIISSKTDVDFIDDSLGDVDFVFYVVTQKLLLLPNIFSELESKEHEKYRFLICESISTKLKNKHNYDFINLETGINNILSSVGGLESSIIKYSRIERPSEINPFGAVRAEYFETSAKLAKIFCPPEDEKYDYLISSRPIIIEGGRGSGKTMSLMSLEANIAIERTNSKNFTSSNLPYFGIYFHVNRGSFVLTSQSEIQALGNSNAKVLFLDDLNLQFTEKLIRTVLQCTTKNFISLDLSTQNKISNEICILLGKEDDKKVETFHDLLNWIEIQKREIRKFLAKKAMGLDYDYNGCFTEINSFNKICNVFQEYVSEFKNKTFFILLDEYENFLKYQQVIVNTLIKRSDNSLSVKVATKYHGLYTTNTLFENQPLQASNDYFKIDLDYNILDDDELENYKKLLIDITKKMLGDKFSETNIAKLLEGATDDPRVSKSDLVYQLEKMYEHKRTEFSNFDEKEIDKKINYYKNTLTFRHLFDNKMRKRWYSGIDSYVSLSSGIVRLFLELCGMTYNIAYSKGIDVFTMKTIPKEIQSDAVHTVSDALVDKLALSVEDYGEKMQHFVMNIGELFRYKLLLDNNEPETIGIGITGIRDLWSKDVQELMDNGVRESVFQIMPESRKKKEKNISDLRTTEYYLNRIYAPTLGISHTARWRSIRLTPEEMAEIMKNDRKSTTKLDMISQLKRKRKINLNEKLDDHL